MSPGLISLLRNARFADSREIPFVGGDRNRGPIRTPDLGGDIPDPPDGDNELHVGTLPGAFSDNYFHLRETY